MMLELFACELEQSSSRVNKTDNEDSVVTSPRSSEYKARQSQRKEKKEKQNTQLSDLRKSMNRLDKVIENGASKQKKVQPPLYSGVKKNMSPENHEFSKTQKLHSASLKKQKSDDKKHYQTNEKASCDISGEDLYIPDKNSNLESKLLCDDMADHKSCNSLCMFGGRVDGSAQDFTYYASGNESNDIFKGSIRGGSNRNSDGSMSQGSQPQPKVKKKSPKLVKPKYLKDVVGGPDQNGISKRGNEIKKHIQRKNLNGHKVQGQEQQEKKPSSSMKRSKSVLQPQKGVSQRHSNLTQPIQPDNNISSNKKATPAKDKVNETEIQSNYSLPTNSQKGQRFTPNQDKNGKKSTYEKKSSIQHSDYSYRNKSKKALLSQSILSAGCSKDSITKRKATAPSQTALKFKEAKQMLQKSSQDFDFTIFKEVKKDQHSFSVFQRFCLMLLIIHDELQRVQTESSDQFLKQLNVYSEIVGITDTIEASSHSLTELQPLFSEEPEYKNNRLQSFINKVAIYAKWREQLKEEREEMKEVESEKNDQLNSTKQNIRNQVKEVQKNIKSKQEDKKNADQQIKTEKEGTFRATVKPSIYRKKEPESKSQRQNHQTPEQKSKPSAPNKSSVKSKERSSISSNSNAKSNYKEHKTIENHEQNGTNVSFQINGIIHTEPDPLPITADISKNQNLSQPLLDNATDQITLNKDLEQFNIFTQLSSQSSNAELKRDAQAEEISNIMIQPGATNESIVKQIVPDINTDSKEIQLIKSLWEEIKEDYEDDLEDDILSGKRTFQFTLEKCSFAFSDEEFDGQEFQLSLNKKDSGKFVDVEYAACAVGLQVQKKQSDHFEFEEQMNNLEKEKLKMGRSTSMATKDMIEQYVSNRTDKNHIDMEIIDRIKLLRSKSRENTETLNKRREDTIKSIQLQWNADYYRQEEQALQEKQEQ